MHVPQSLLNRWAIPAVGSLPPDSASSVVTAFAKLGVRVPRDVISLYGLIGGMDVGDQHDWRLWPLAEILQENAPKVQGHIAFSDYMIDCWRFYLEPVNEHVCRVLSDYDGGPMREVSESLELFLASLDTSPLQVIDPSAWTRRRVEKRGTGVSNLIGSVLRRFSRNAVVVCRCLIGLGGSAK
jgi:hypothetical protein